MVYLWQYAQVAAMLEGLNALVDPLQLAKWRVWIEPHHIAEQRVWAPLECKLCI